MKTKKRPKLIFSNEDYSVEKLDDNEALLPARNHATQNLGSTSNRLKIS